MCGADLYGRRWKWNGILTVRASLSPRCRNKMYVYIDRDTRAEIEKGIKFEVCDVSTAAPAMARCRISTHCRIGIYISEQAVRSWLRKDIKISGRTRGFVNTAHAHIHNTLPVSRVIQAYLAEDKQLLLHIVRSARERCGDGGKDGREGRERRRGRAVYFC